MTVVDLTPAETVRALVAEFPQLFALEPGLDGDDLRAADLRSQGNWPPHPWVISSDGGRGAWAVAVDPAAGAWGPVTSCNDLLRCEVQARSLREYIEQFRDAARPVPTSPHTCVLDTPVRDHRS
jgi:hypothetical protein